MRKSQYATEYLLVVGIGLLILIPSLALFYNYSLDQTDDAVVERIGTIGRTIVNNAETVFYMGPPSRRTLEENFPNKIHNITINSTNDGDYYEIRFIIGDRRSVYPFASNVPISGPFYHNRTGQHCHDLGTVCFTPGNRLIILDANPTNVSIIIR